MPKVKIQKSIDVQADKLFATMQKVLTKDKEVKALEPNLEICTTDSSKGCLNGTISGSRINGTFEITPKGKGSSVKIELIIPLMLAPFKGIVQRKIEEKLDQLA